MKRSESGRGRFIGGSNLAQFLGLGCLLAMGGIWNGLKEEQRLSQGFPQPSSTYSPESLSTPTEFYLPGCPACEQSEPVLAGVEGDGLAFRRIDTTTMRGRLLLHEYVLAYKLPEADKGKLPLAFLGDRYLVGQDGMRDHLAQDATRWKKGEGKQAPILDESLVAQAAKQAGQPANLNCCSEAKP